MKENMQIGKKCAADGMPSALLRRLHLDYL